MTIQQDTTSTKTRVAGSRTVEFQPGTRNIFFHILTKCNLRCMHCYINAEQHGTQTLDAETIAAWLRLFVKGSDFLENRGVAADNVPEKTNVIFLGGEPTLNPALAQGIKEARSLGYGSITVDTNGYLFNNILDSVTPDEVDYFSFSLDGSSPEHNDPIRGKGSFEKCTGGILEAVNRGFRVSSIFTASARNIDDLPNMPDLLYKLGVRRFFIQVIGIRGNPAKKGGEALQLDRDRWEAIVPGVASRCAELGMHVTWPSVFVPQGREFACAGLVADNYFVFPNGRVYTCPLCEDYPIHSYEIENGQLVKMPPINEQQLYGLNIPEGCVMNRILHPGNIRYTPDGKPVDRIACCMLKEELVV